MDDPASPYYTFEPICVEEFRQEQMHDQLYTGICHKLNEGGSWDSVWTIMESLSEQETKESRLLHYIP